LSSAWNLRLRPFRHLLFHPCLSPTKNLAFERAEEAEDALKSRLGL
jgi:hypothetical protein